MCSCFAAFHKQANSTCTFILQHIRFGAIIGQVEGLICVEDICWYDVRKKVLLKHISAPSMIYMIRCGRDVFGHDMVPLISINLG